MLKRNVIKGFTRIFSDIMLHGRPIAHFREYCGVRAWSEAASLQCFIQYKNVTVKWMFRGHYEIDYQSKDDLVLFDNKLRQLGYGKTS